MSIITVLISGILNVATDPQPYTQPSPVPQQQGLVCNKNGQVNQSGTWKGLVCHPKAADPKRVPAGGQK